MPVDKQKQMKGHAWWPSAREPHVGAVEFPMDRLELMRELLVLLDGLQKGATLDDLRELLKAELVEAALKKDALVKIEGVDAFIKAFGGKAGQ